MAGLKRYTVNVIIENRPSIRDPEGETILRDLMIKNGFSTIRSVRTAKLLKLNIEAGDEEEAKTLVEKMCNDLRIFNPVVSLCTVTVTGDGE